MYAIVDVRQEEDNLLLMIRNGWGFKPVLWEGKYSKRLAPNGSLWMDLSEFIQNFTVLYVCRLHSDTIKHYVKVIVHLVFKSHLVGEMADYFRRIRISKFSWSFAL